MQLAGSYPFVAFAAAVVVPRLTAAELVVVAVAELAVIAAAEPALAPVPELEPGHGLDPPPVAGLAGLAGLAELVLVGLGTAAGFAAEEFAAVALAVAVSIAVVALELASFAEPAGSAEVEGVVAGAVAEESREQTAVVAELEFAGVGDGSAD